MLFKYYYPYHYFHLLLSPASLHLVVVVVVVSFVGFVIIVVVPVVVVIVATAGELPTLLSFIFFLILSATQTDKKLSCPTTNQTKNIDKKTFIHNTTFAVQTTKFTPSNIAKTTTTTAKNPELEAPRHWPDWK